MIGTYDRVKLAILHQTPVRYYCTTIADAKHLCAKMCSLIKPTHQRDALNISYDKCEISFRIINDRSTDNLMGFRGVVFEHPELEEFTIKRNVFGRFREFRDIANHTNGRHPWLQ